MYRKSNRKSLKTQAVKRISTENKISFLKHLSAFSITIANKKYIKWISLLLLTISVFVYYMDIGDYDIWFHLKYGEHYVKNLTWDIDHSVFSWTPTDTNWKYVTWIGSSILYIAYQIASVPGLYIIQWIIFFSTFGIYYYYTKSTGDGFDINNITGLMLVAAALAPTLCIIKPELFTFLFFTISVFIYFYSKSTLKNLFFLYPLLFLIWVNTH